MILKTACLSAFVVAAFASSQLAFDVSAIDARGSDEVSAKQSSDMELSQKATLSDVELVQTHARPIFSQSRRPFVAKPHMVEQPVAIVEHAMAQQPGGLPRRLILLGTNVGGSAASALVRNQENEEVRWLKVGESFDGWILSSTSGDQAAFVCQERQGNDCEYSLTLYSDARSN
jgi:hypothetical protein